MSYGSEAAALNALLSIFAGFWLVILAFFVLNIVAGWKIFEKAGQPGWASIVPFYNSYIRYKIFWGNGWPVSYTHLSERYVSVIPITHATVEVGSFDTMLLQSIQKGEAKPEGADYQKGPRYNLATLREAVFYRDNYTCQVLSLIHI